MNNKQIDLSLIIRPTVRDLLRVEKVRLNTLRVRIKRALSDPLISDRVPERVELCLTLLDNEEIHFLNREYREKDKPTDVLSFALQEGEQFYLPEDIATPLGDLMISVETAIYQSKRGALPRLRPHLKSDEWGLSDELSFLALHGLLHLLGFDHEREEEAEQMEALEASLLRAILPRKVQRDQRLNVQ